MIIPLARKTLVHEWRRFLPAMLTVALSGVLLMMLTALVFGILGATAVYMRTSNAQVWVGYPGTQTIELGRPIPPTALTALLMDRRVAQAEPFAWFNGDWQGPPGTGGVSVFVSGINIQPNGLMFSTVLTPAQRALLQRPFTVIVDRTDLPKLGVPIGGRALINGQVVKIVGTADGIRALGGVNVIASLPTARALDNGPDDTEVQYYVARLKPDASPAAVVAHINRDALGYVAWTATGLAHSAVMYWMFQTSAGVSVIFLSLVVFVVGVIITSQTLMGAIAGSIHEYATLLALGVGLRQLRRVVLAQSAWIGVCGLVVGIAVSLVLMALIRVEAVPAQLNWPVWCMCAVLVVGIALVSGLAAVRVLRNTDPASLLR